MNIAIIGAGYTGLTAALRLATQGHKITIFESSHELGGLASTVTVEKTKIERFYHHLFRTDTAILNLIKELGLSKKIIKRKSNVGIVINKIIYPFNGVKDLLKFKPLNIIDRVRLGAVSFYLTKTPFKKQWNKITAAEWMEKYCGKKAFEIVWKPLLTGKFDHYWDKISMNWLWARIHVRANSRSNPFEDEFLYYFDGGFDVIVEKIVKQLKRKDVTILLNTPVKKITSEKLITVETEKKKYTFDKIISTTSNVIFNKIAIEHSAYAHKKYANQLINIKYLHAVCIMFTSSQSLSSYYWHNINNIDSPFMVFIQHTNFISKKEYDGKNVYYLAKYTDSKTVLEQTDSNIQKSWFKYVKTLFTNFDPKKVDHVTISKVPFAQHIADTTYTENIPSFKTPIKNVYLCNFSQIYPYDRGTNYAVEEGEKIAKLIMKG